MSDIPTQKPDIRAVARAANVSVTTVSRCFNHPDKVNPATRQKVAEAAEKLGYIRNRAAQSMQGVGSGLVGVVIPNDQATLQTKTLLDLSQSLSVKGKSILLQSFSSDPDASFSAARICIEHQVDGMIFSEHSPCPKTRQLLLDHAIPALQLGGYDPDTPLSSIGPDNRAAGEMAAACLLDHGHYEIGLMVPPTRSGSVMQSRFEGAVDALKLAGIRFPPEWVFEGISPARLPETITALFHAPHRPTALLCATDQLGVGVIQATHAAGKRVPQDLSVIGIGDAPEAAMIRPALTTVHVPTATNGNDAAEVICALTDDPAAGPVRINSPLQLKLRQTCRTVLL